MVGSIFDGCGDGCGWTAAFISALAYGSYGVPIKATAKIDAHPLVFQSYKTCVMFIMSWSVLWMGVQAAWTPWGLVSGFLWVIGGTGGIYGIRMAGLAIAVGTWASVMILVNFVWGILIFREPVRNIWSTLGAFLLLGCGLVGMSHYSAPQNKQQHQHQQQLDDNDINDTVHSMENKNNSNKSTTYGSGLDNNNTNDPERSLIPPSQEQQQGTHFSLVDGKKNDQPDTTLVGGHIVNKRAAGIAGAVFNGLMTGSSLIPLHYAEQEGFGGARYMISFASGALISNIMIWFVWWAVCFADTYQRDVAGSKLRQTADNMPQWHFYQLWLPAGIAGILLSIAMFGSILSVTYLGQGVGNSLVQSKILVSGLWGIFWYQEIRGRRTIVSWFIAASLTVTGILWLSQERMSAKSSDSGDHHRILFGF